MRVLFVVQGEGRGHLTQAISLAQLLQQAGHQLVGAWVNVADGRPVPAFFREQFKGPITAVAGPLLVYNPQTNALDLKNTLRGILGNLGCYQRSLIYLRDAIEEQQPDVVVNFFELLGGLTFGIYRPNVPMVCVGHQCMAFHPVFPFPLGQWLDRLLFKALIRLNAWGATERWGLSFDELPDKPGQRLRVMPPLLRQELTVRHRVSKADSEPFVLAYTTQPGLQTEVLKANQQRPDIPIRYFHPQTKVVEKRSDTLEFRPIDGRQYLDAMQHCRAVMTTAGFESVCEALYLGKPVLMMPQPAHYEQACNALDGQRVGAGIADCTFDLDRLMDYTDTYDERRSEQFRKWYAQGQRLFLTALQRVTDQSKKGVGAQTILSRFIKLNSDTTF
ncbi:glycosyltransferase family protein [Spirosoma gilvum]